jgi:pantetheine-phosphate adenylyltransferase
MTTAVYAGSFDPITKGHLDLIYRSTKTFERLVVAVGINSAKKPLFTLDERIAMIQASIDEQWQEAHEAWGTKNVIDPGAITVTSFDDLLVDFCKREHATVIVRGLRAVTDFEAELGIAHANASLAPNLDTFFLPTKPKFSFVSSSTVREIARHPSPTGWDSLDKYVTKAVLRALRDKFLTP